jgi:Cd2+/Zn2+-exporting ATPase
MSTAGTADSPLDRRPGVASSSDNAPTSGFFARFAWLATPAISGAFLLVGFVCELLGLPAWTWLPAYAVCFIVAGLHPIVEGVRQLLRLSLDIDFLMIVAALGAAIIGEIAEGGLLLVLFAIGHALEDHAMGSARSAIKALGHIAPRTARLRRDGVERDVPVEELAIGDVIVVRPTERVPADGVVAEGTSDLDQSPITGESVPVAKSPGDPVFAGTLNGDGGLLITVRKLASESTMARMARLVAEAEAQKAPTQRLAERFTRIYVPLVVLAVIVVAVVPPWLGWLTWSEAFLRAMTLLVGASPCALGLSTPAAMLAAIARAARNGVLIKGGASLERLATVQAVAMDKTGTITSGRPSVVAVEAIGGFDETELLRLAASVERLSTHPLAVAVLNEAAKRGIEPEFAEQATLKKGKGIAANVGGRRVIVASPRSFDEGEGPRATKELREACATLESRGCTVAVVAVDDRFAGFLGLQDRPRPEARSAFEGLRARGVKSVAMLTGDNKDVAKAIGREVGVDEIEAELLPEHKIDRVKALQRRHGSIAMVGDGVNDAPALASADVGIAMGAGGTDVALEAADVALMNDDLRKLAFAIGLSRAARRIVLQNVAIAMGVVLVLVVLATAGLVPMPIAVVMHEGSTVVVVLNALRLLRYEAR